MAVKVGEFFISMAVDAASGNLSVNDLVASLGKLDVVSVGTVGVLSKITSTLWGLGKAAASTAVEMSVLRDISGADPKMVQQWEKAAQRINVQAGSIVGAVKGVNDMMGSIAARKSAPPMELTGWLGIAPQKGTDGKGNPVMKNFFDLMGEIAKPTSRYWGYSAQVQQQLLGGAFPGADSKDIFRILNEMRAGRFKPENIGVLEDKQVAELTGIKRKETEIGQQMVGIFDKLIIGGNAFARVLEAVSTKLEVMDKWLASKQGQGAIGAVGSAAANVVNHASVNPMTGFGLYYSGQDYGKFLGQRFFGVNEPKGSQVQSLKLDDLKGRLDINIFGPGGTQIGKSQAFLGTKVSNADVERTTINTGNGGLGQ